VSKGLLPAAVLALAVPGLAAAADPWRFPNKAAQADAKCTGYFNENYDAAKTLLEKDRVANADAAIAKLRCAIEKRDKSGPTPVPGGTRVDYYPYLYLAMAFSAKPDPASAVAAQQCMQAETKSGMPAREAQKYSAIVKGIADHAAAAGFLAAAQRLREWEAGKGTVTLTPGAGQRLSSIKSLVEQIAKARPDEDLPTERLASELRGLAADEMKARADELRGLDAEPWKKWIAAAGGDPSATCRTGPGDSAGAALDAVEKCFQSVGAALRAAGRGECEDLAAARKGYAEDLQALKTWDEWENAGHGKAEEPAALPPTCDTKWKDEPYATLAPVIDRLKTESAKARRDFQEQQRTVGAALQKKRDDLRSCQATQLAGVPEIPADCTGALGLGAVSSRLAQVRQRLSPDRIPAKGLPPKELVPCGKTAGDLITELRDSAERGAAVLAANKGCPNIEGKVLTELEQSLQAYKSGSLGNLGPLCQSAMRAKTAVDRCWQENTPLLTRSLKDYGTLLAVARRDTAPQFAASGGGVEGAPGCVAKVLESLSGVQKGPGGRVDVWAKQAVDARQRAQECLDDLARLAVGRFGRVRAAFQSAREGMDPLMADLRKGTGGGVEALPEVLRGAIASFEAVEKKAAGIALVEPLYEECASSVAAREALDRAGISWGADEKDGGVPPDTSQGLQPDARSACVVVRDAAVSRWLGEIDKDLAQLQQKTAGLGPYLIVNGLFSRIAAGDVDGAVQKVREVRGRRSLPAEGREAALTQATIAYVFFLKKRQLEVQKADRPVLEAVEAEAREAADRAGKALAAFRPPEGLFPGEAFRTWYENTVRP
jgi:hypothetical protein